MNERELFNRALDIPDAAERAAYLDRACADQPELRRQVEQLLKAHLQAGEFLNQPHPAVGPAEHTGAYVSQANPAETAGMVIAGRYKLLQQIGEGGMGSVWMADQLEPVKRRVAVKLIKEGMDSQRVLARFEAERQALAMMDHPNIAKVLDAGTTGLLGRPYFVMELVKGTPINEFCDAQKLNIGDRLNLFMQVCSAVQHAHQKGIIHRDLKPTNILVESHDGKPVPKVIDFGLAKAMSGQPLTEHTLFTQLGTVAGTPLYMAPEQAAFNAIDVDTRADIYALGVILYELLTGTTPIEREQLKKRAFDEILRVIRESEPPTPSKRLSSTESKPSVAAVRGMEPAKLGRFLRGELDWIVMKALAKERDRRYETANGFAKDIERFLNHEPVLAGPPSAGYKLRKFVRRNRLQVVAGAMVLMALIGGIAGTSFGLIRAKQRQREAEQAWAAEADRAEGERQAKEREAEQRGLAEQRKQAAEANEKRAIREKQIADAVTDFLQKKLLGQADLHSQADSLVQTRGVVGAASYDPTIRELLDRAAIELSPERIEANFPQQPLVQAAILETVGNTYRGIGEYGSAIGFLQRSAALYEKELGRKHADTLNTLSNLAAAYWLASRLPEAIRLFEEVRAIHQVLGKQGDLDALATLQNLAGAYKDAGRLRASITLAEQIRNTLREKLGPDNWRTLTSMHNLALAYEAAGRLAEARRLLEEARDRREKTLGADHPDSISTMEALAGVYSKLGKSSDAVRLLEQVRDFQIKKRGPDDPLTLAAQSNLAVALSDAGKWREATELLERCRAVSVKKLGPDHIITLTVLQNLASEYETTDRVTEAFPLLQQVHDGFQKKLGPDHIATLNALANLAKLYRRTDKLAEAIQFSRQAKEGFEKKLGPHHPTTLLAMHGLALAYEKAGRMPEAIELLEQTHKAMDTHLGPEHPATLAILASLSESCQKAGKIPEAIRFGEQARAGFEKTFGPDHPETLSSICKLAEAHAFSRNFQEAIRLFEQARDAQLKFPGLGHSDTLRTLTGLSGAYREAGRMPEAIRIAEQARDGYAKLFGPTHLNTLIAMNNLALTYERSGRLPEAIELHEKTRDGIERILGPTHPNTMIVSWNLGLAYVTAGQFERAIARLEPVVRDFEKGGFHNRNSARGISNLVACYEKLKQWDKAESWLRKWFAVIKEGSKPESPAYVAALISLGSNLLDQGKCTEAEPLLRECLAIREKMQPEAWNTFNTKSMLGAALLGQKKYTDAEPLLIAGYEGMKKREDKIPKEARNRVTEAIERLVNLYQALDKKDQADKWRQKLKEAKEPEKNK